MRNQVWEIIEFEKNFQKLITLFDKKDEQEVIISSFLTQVDSPGSALIDYEKNVDRKKLEILHYAINNRVNSPAIRW